MIGANTLVSSPTSEGRASNDNKHWLLNPFTSTGLATIGEDPYRGAPTSPRGEPDGGELQSLRGALSNNIHAISMLQVQMAAAEESTAELRRQLSALQGAARAAGDLQTGASARADAGAGRSSYQVAKAESAHIGRVCEDFYERAVAHANWLVVELRSEMSREFDNHVASVMEHADASVSLLRSELRRYIAEFRGDSGSTALGGGASSLGCQAYAGRPRQHEPCAAPAGGAAPPVALTRKIDGPGRVAIPPAFLSTSVRSRPELVNRELKETLSGLDRSIRVFLKDPSTSGLPNRAAGEVLEPAALGPPAPSAAGDGVCVSGQLHGPANPTMARRSLPSLALQSSASSQLLHHRSSHGQWQPHQSSDVRPAYTSVAPGMQYRDHLNSPLGSPRR